MDILGQILAMLVDMCENDIYEMKCYICTGKPVMLIYQLCRHICRILILVASHKLVAKASQEQSRGKVSNPNSAE